MTMLSDAPAVSAYQFIETALDIAARHGVKRVFAVSGMASLAAHTTPREIMANFNSSTFRDTMSGFEINREMDFTSSGSQRPSINSLLIWAAGRRGMDAATLGCRCPFTCRR